MMNEREALKHGTEGDHTKNPRGECAMNWLTAPGTPRARLLRERLPMSCGAHLLAKGDTVAHG